jgi:hypothetical protein
MGAGIGFESRESDSCPDPQGQTEVAKLTLEGLRPKQLAGRR